MPSRADFEKMNARVAEAVALCEAAQERFEQIHAEMLKTFHDGHQPPRRVSNQEDEARTRLFEARLELSKQLRARRRFASADD
ncbi:MAG TPA: hypothetical protein VFX89_20075 [Gammaproteobacteria bacterium]|nr:hypothetical protein [Gammaproteobacteria bacterium]